MELLTLHLVHKKYNMGLKEQLLENKSLNEQNQFKVSEEQSFMTYQLGYEFDTDQEVDYDAFYQPFIHEYADLQLKLDTGKSENPVQDRKRVKEITDSVEVIRQALENVMSSTEIWTEAVVLSGGMGGVDLMGTPPSRYEAINILSDQLKGVILIKAIDDNISRLAWDIYNDQYVLSLQQAKSGNFNTLSYDEQVQGWTSFYNYKPDQMFSIKNNFYSIASVGAAVPGYALNNYAVYKHYSDTANRSNFYGIDYRSSVT